MKKFFAAIFKIFALTAVFIAALFIIAPITAFIPIHIIVCSLNLTSVILAAVITFITKKLVFAK